MRVLLIEGSRELVDSLRRRLSQVGFDVESANDGKAGLRMAIERSYDVIVLDVMLPVLGGSKLLEELRRNDQEVLVLILTAARELDARVRGLRAGADDCLAKPFEFEELLARLQALTRRKFGAKSVRIVVAHVEIDTVTRTVRRDGEFVSLTKREYRLLEFLAFRRGKIVSREEIQEHLYGWNATPLSNVVDSAICSLRSKLCTDGSPRLIHTRPRLGYLLSEDDS